MATRCEKCGRQLADRSNRFCHQHARQVLNHLESVGYLQPLTISTVDAPNQKLSPKRFLTLHEEPYRGTMKSLASPAGSGGSSPKSPPPSTRKRAGGK